MKMTIARGFCSIEAKSMTWQMSPFQSRFRGEEVVDWSSGLGIDLVWDHLSSQRTPCWTASRALPLFTRSDWIAAPCCFKTDSAAAARMSVEPPPSRPSARKNLRPFAADRGGRSAERNDAESRQKPLKGV